MEARIVHLSVRELMVGSAAFSAKQRRDGCEAQAFNIPEDRHEKSSPVIDLDLTLLWHGRCCPRWPFISCAVG